MCNTAGLPAGRTTALLLSQWTQGWLQGSTQGWALEKSQKREMLVKVDKGEEIYVKYMLWNINWNVDDDDWINSLV